MASKSDNGAKARKNCKVIKILRGKHECNGGFDVAKQELIPDGCW